MAYSLGDRENQQILEEIKQMASCPICGCEYDEHTNRPKVLPCAYKRHTLFKVCIENQIQHSCIDGMFECPFCRHQHETPPEGEDLNEHYTDCILLPQLSDLLQRQMLRNDTNSRPKVCHPICDSCNPAKHNEAVAWCDSCSQILCDECREMHDDRLLLKGHPLSTPLNSIDLGKIERKASCQKHKREDITWVCYHYNLEGEYLCNECVKDGRHKDHTHVDLKTETEKEKTELEDLLTNARTKNKKFIDLKDKLKIAMDTLKRNSDDVELKIDTCQDKFMTMLEDHKESKKCEFLEIKEEKSNKLKKQAQETDKWLSILQNIENEVDQLQHASPISKLEHIKKISNALNEYLALKIDDAPTNVYMKVQKFNSDKEFQECLDKSTKITTRPSQFQVAYPAVAFQDHEFELHIQSISNSERCTIGGLPVRARVNSPCCSDHNILELTPRDERNGKYVLHFKPKSTGLYKFHIYLEDNVEPVDNIDICVHLAEFVYNRLTPCYQTYQLQVSFKTKIDLDVIQNLDVTCNGEVCAAVQPQGIIYQPDFIAEFLPTKLGKIRTCITSNDMRIAGPFTTSVCKKIMWDCADNIISEEDAVTDIAVHKDGHVYLAITTPSNRKIVLFNYEEEPIFANPVVSYQNEGISALFIAFDKDAKLFVLNVTNIKEDADTEIDTKTELQIITPNGQHSYILESLTSPGGLAVSPSGSIVAISDKKEHKICLFNLPEATEHMTPFKVLGEYGNVWGKFVNPTGLCIKREEWLFVCDTDNGRIQELDMNGNTVHVYGSLRRLQHPESVCFSSEGHLLILDGEKLVAIDVDSHCRKTICEIEISCNGRKCDFNHQICCLPDCQVLRICCRNNDMNIFRYAVSQR